MISCGTPWAALGAVKIREVAAELCSSTVSNQELSFVCLDAVYFRGHENHLLLFLEDYESQSQELMCDFLSISLDTVGSIHNDHPMRRANAV